MADYFLFILQFAPQLLQDSWSQDLATFFLVLISSTHIVKNPYLVSKFVEILFVADPSIQRFALCPFGRPSVHLSLRHSVRLSYYGRLNSWLMAFSAFLSALFSTSFLSLVGLWRRRSLFQLSHVSLIFVNRHSSRLHDLVTSHPSGPKILASSLMRFYTDVESTGASSEFYDKFTFRYHISIVMKSMWDSPIHKLAILNESK